MKRPSTFFLSAFALTLTLLTPLGMSSQSQCLRLSERCEGELGDFLSDGNYYGASVNGVTEATIKLTLYEGFKYRIVTCNDRPNAKVKYRVLDSRKTEVFQTQGAKDGDAWEFELSATDVFTIKASIPGNAGLGCIVFEVGYDEDMLDVEADFEEEDDPFFEDELDYEDPDDAGN